MGTIFAFLDWDEELVKEVCKRTGTRIVKVITTDKNTKNPFSIYVEDDQYKMIASHAEDVICKWETKNGKYFIHNMLVDNQDGACTIPPSAFLKLKTMCQTHQVIAVWKKRIGVEAYGGILLRSDSPAEEFLRIIGKGKYLGCKKLDQVFIEEEEKKEEEFAGYDKEYARIERHSYFEHYVRNEDNYFAALKKERMKIRRKNTEELEMVLQEGERYRIMTMMSAMSSGIYTGSEMVGKLKLYCFNEDGSVRKFTNPDLAFGKIYGENNTMLFDGTSKEVKVC